MLIDTHITAFTRPLFEHFAQMAKDARRHTGSLAEIADQLQIDIPSEDPSVLAKRWLGVMDDHGIGKAVLHAQHISEAEAVEAMIAVAPDRFAGLCQVNPLMPSAHDDVPCLVEQRGFRAIGLQPTTHHYQVADMPWLLDYLQSHDIALHVNCGLLKLPLFEAFRLPPISDIRYGNPLDLIRVAKAFPDLRIIVPHFGAGFLRECLMLGRSCPNVFIGTSSANSWLITNGITLEDALFRAVNAVGHHRLLFGSDSGYFPQGWRKGIHDIQQRTAQKLELPLHVIDAILGGNAESVFFASPSDQ